MNRLYYVGCVWSNRTILPFNPSAWRARESPGLRLARAGKIAGWRAQRGEESFIRGMGVFLFSIIYALAVYPNNHQKLNFITAINDLKFSRELGVNFIKAFRLRKRLLIG